jgi:hypothetical protein
MEADIGNTGRVRRDQFFTDITGKILVFGFPLFVLRVEKNGSSTFVMGKSFIL